MADPDFQAIEPNEDSSDKLAQFWDNDFSECSYFPRGIQGDEEEEEEVTVVQVVSRILEWKETWEREMVVKIHSSILYL